MYFDFINVSQAEPENVKKCEKQSEFSLGDGLSIRNEEMTSSDDSGYGGVFEG